MHHLSYGAPGSTGCKVLVWPIVRNDNRYTLRIADKTVSYLPFKLISTISGGPGPSSFEYRNILLPFRHGVNVELFLLASAVTLTA